MNLKALAYQLRRDTIDIICAGKAGHIGGDMSVMEVLVELYFDQMNIDAKNPEDPDRDLFVLSKGHSMEAYYAVLSEKGFLDKEDVLKNFSKFGSKYIGHPNNKLPGIEMNSGSLGHGLPVCVGMAKAAKMDHKDRRVYVVMGDGELAEGSVCNLFFTALVFCDNLFFLVNKSDLNCFVTVILNCFNLCYYTWSSLQYSYRNQDSCLFIEDLSHSDFCSQNSFLHYNYLL